MNLAELSHLLYQVKLAAQESQALFEKETGFSLTRYELLMVLHRKQTCRQSEIQSELKIDQGAITRHLKILEEKGYVTRTRNAANNREILVELTEKARQELLSCFETHDKPDETLGITLTAAEASQLLELSKKIY